jgi:hypothetical protein
MVFPYFVGLYLGIMIGKANGIGHTEKIIKLENKLKEYERLFGKIN